MYGSKGILRVPDRASSVSAPPDPSSILPPISLFRFQYSIGGRYNRPMHNRFSLLGTLHQMLKAEDSGHRAHGTLKYTVVCSSLDRLRPQHLAYDKFTSDL